MRRQRGNLSINQTEHLCCSTRDTYLWFSHRKDQLLHALLPDSRLPLLARDHHEIVTATTKGNHRLVGVCDQRVLKNESMASVKCAVKWI